MVKSPLRAIIGLGNPGAAFDGTRHNAGFMVLDRLADRYGARFSDRDKMQVAQFDGPEGVVLLIKPLTFMNSSGEVMPFLSKKGIRADQILVVHDELEMPFGKVKLKEGGGARGHNGLRSFISFIGQDFLRLPFGIGRPEIKEQVPKYVLERFSEPRAALDKALDEAVALIVERLS